MSEIKDKLITAENLKNAYNDNKRQICELKDDLSEYCVCKNLVGREKEKKYYAHIPKGKYWTVSTKDLVPLDSALYIDLYLEDGSYYDYWSLIKGQSRRTIKDDAKDTYYLAIRTWSDIPIQIELGDNATDFVEHYDNVRDIEDRVYMLETQSESANIVKKYAKRKDFKLDKYNVSKNSDATFAFFSDLHGGETNLNRIVELSNNLKLNAILNGGDLVQNWNSDSTTFYNTAITNSPMDLLSCIGNHDAWKTGKWEKAPVTDIYNKIIKPFVTKYSGIVQPPNAEANGLCYFYKDYGNVRVIGLDSCNDNACGTWDNAQKQWLINVLDDAKNNNKHVICLNHYPFPKDIAKYDTDSNWCSFEDYKTDPSYDRLYPHMETLNVIDDFIKSGGNFVCWLAGHTHDDFVMTATGYESQFMIVTASANNTKHSDGLVTSDMSDDMFDCFNLIGVDTAHKLLKMKRIGWNKDASMKERNSLCYDYKNHKLIASN